MSAYQWFVFFLIIQVIHFQDKPILSRAFHKTRQRIAVLRFTHLQLRIYQIIVLIIHREF